MHKRTPILVALLLLNAATFCHPEEAASQPAKTFGHSEFNALVTEAGTTILQSYPTDEGLTEGKLAAGALKGLARWTAKQPEDVGAEFAPALKGTYGTCREFLESIGAGIGQGIDWQLAADYSVSGMVEAIGDPHSHYMTVEEIRRLAGMIGEGLKDTYGVLARFDEDGNLVVNAVLYGTAGFYYGLRGGDRILEIDGKAVSIADRVEIARSFAPEKPAEMRIKLQRTGWKEPVELTLQPNREMIPIVLSGMPFPGIGYVRATLFGGQMTSKVYAAMKDLKSNGAKAYILDLRNNPGGEALEAVNLVDLFLRGRKVATIMKFYTAGQAMTQSMPCFGNETEFESVPLVVLVNDSSASASEMASGCLQDYQRATIVGTQTFGKGVAQVARGLLSSRGTRFLYLTTAKYALPSGRSIHKVGITPDIVVRDGEGFSGSETYYRVLGWDAATAFVRKMITRYPDKAAAIGRGEPVRLEDGRDLDSLRRKAGIAFGAEGADCLDSALRTRIAAEYCLGNGKFQPYDEEDEVLVMAQKRLVFESGMPLK